MKTRFVHIPYVPSATIILSLLLAFILTACSFDGIGANPAAIQHSNVSIISPQSRQQTSSPLTVRGTSKALTGKLLKITVLDHNHAFIGQGVAPQFIEEDANEAVAFSSSVPYTSSFLDGAQEGILALYVYNTSGAIITVAMVKVLLT